MKEKTGFFPFAFFFFLLLFFQVLHPCTKHTLMHIILTLTNMLTASLEFSNTIGNISTIGTRHNVAKTLGFNE